MREVSACDFCGEEAIGTFEVVPPERDPAGEGRRMVLCRGCRDTLGTVLEPLLERERSAEPDTAPAGETGTTTVVAEPDRKPNGETATDPAPDPGSGSAPDTGSSEGRNRGPAADGTSPGDGDADPSTGGESVEGEESGRPTSVRRGAPSGYRKVMRFLENREFPIDREEAETLAAEAYGMDPGAVSAAVDHAVKHGRLREASGDLLQ